MTLSSPINFMQQDPGLRAETEACCSPAPPRVKMEEVAANARLLGALADPTRLGIVSMLAGLDEPLCVCEIVTQFDLGQPTISHHLRVLREAKLVDCEKRGLWVYYWLNREVFSEVAAYLSNLQRAVSGSLAL